MLILLVVEQATEGPWSNLKSQVIRGMEEKQDGPYLNVCSEQGKEPQAGTTNRFEPEADKEAGRVAAPIRVTRYLTAVNTSSAKASVSVFELYGRILSRKPRERDEKETPLANAVFWAARKGNLALLQLLLNSGRVDVDCKDGYGTTALMVASYSGHYECVHELIMQGADINLQRETGSTALFLASQQGHNNIIKLLFQFGASSEFRTENGGTAVCAACQHGHGEALATLLKNGANVHDQLSDGATALFLACQEGHVDVTRTLLASGAKVNQPREDGTAPLWIAAQMGHTEIVKVLLLRGADREAHRKDGSTALFKAAHKGHLSVMEELLKFSPSLGLLQNGSTVLHAAVMGGSLKAVSLLLKANADPALRNQNMELAEDLTKSERILRLLRRPVLNGEG
ncbi:hypothetical protein DNTS_027939 [Danionella cerebrum]|uniref:Uncharacterized protein n=1 Tax=Danionella cerebrum TaxID=2873325 RepID=A0A553QWP5_9TELE|nr:hypothetical protein DNTS_027939 [Danionella translucida]